MARSAFALIVLAAASISAQQPEFKSGVELVTVPVTVTSRDHNTYIEGLTAADFQLSENGERQVVTTVTRERRPLSICFVVDSSGSMAFGNRKILAIQSTDRIVEQLKPDDEISIAFVGQDVEERLPWTPANAEALRRIDAATPGASDAIRGNNRRALPNFDYLERVVGDSGGSSSRVVSQPEVIMAAKNIVDELQYEYLIGYSPAKPLDGKYRRLKVEVARRGVFIRHRGGYLALPSSQ